jgi:hypothetical protein
MIFIRTLTETLKALGMLEKVTSLLSQRGEHRREGLLPGYADLQNLRCFLASWHPAKRRQAKGNAIGILNLAHAMALGHAKERLDRIGTDRSADPIEP